MESQNSAHVAAAPLRAVVPPPLRPQAVTTTTTFPYLNVDHLMLLNPTPIVGAPCLISSQPILCTCVYGSQHCTLHQAPIAYGQASSSYVHPTVPQTNVPADQNQNNASSSDSRSQSNNPNFNGPFLPQVDASEARMISSASTGLPAPMRTMSVRLKRQSQLAPRVASALEAAVRPPKLRRVVSDAPSGRESQSQVRPEAVAVVAPEPQQPQEPQSTAPTASQVPPSTSQLVTGPVPSSHQTACAACGAGPGPTRCSACAITACPCAMCPTNQGQVAAPQSPLQPPTHAHLIRAINSQSVMNQASFVELQRRQQQLDQVRAAALITHQQQQRLMQVQAAQAQAQQQQQSLLRYMYQPSSGMALPVRSNAAALSAVHQYEQYFYSTIFAPEFLERNGPVLERHHMFATPVSEPQPIGLSANEIENCTKKVHFVKDIEVPEEEQERCTVCQCELETGEEVRSLHCSHQFHVGCIDRWLGYNKKCPICRLDIDQVKAVLVE